MNNKYLKLLPILVILVLLLPIYTYGKNELSNSNGDQNRIQDPTTHTQDQTVSNQGSGNNVQNQVQNQIKTQNSGEEQNLNIETTQQLKQQFNSNDNLIQKAHEVSKYVHQLLDEENKGIGNQVREIAKAQNKTQEEINSYQEKIQNRNQFLKFILGNDKQSLESLDEKVLDNQERIDLLTKVMEDLETQEEKDLVQAFIDRLTAQNVALSDYISNETATISVFGWIKDLFSKDKE